MPPPRADVRGTQLRTPATGTVSASLVPPGTLKIAAQCAGYQSTEVSAEVTEGGTTAIELTLRAE